MPGGSQSTQSRGGSAPSCPSSSSESGRSCGGLAVVLVLARGCRWLSPGPLLCSWVPSSDTWTKRVFVPTSVTVLASCVGPADLQRGGLGVRSGPSERPGGLAWAARGRPEAGCAEPQEALPATWAPQSGVVPGPAGQDGAPSTAPASSREDQQRARGPVGPGEDGSSDFWACSLQSLARCSRAVTPRSRRASLWPHSTPPLQPTYLCSVSRGR